MTGAEAREALEGGANALRLYTWLDALVQEVVEGKIGMEQYAVRSLLAIFHAKIPNDGSMLSSRLQALHDQTDESWEGL